MGKAYLFERDEWEFILAQGQVADIVLPVLMAVEPKDQSGLTEPGMEAANEVPRREPQEIAVSLIERSILEKAEEEGKIRFCPETWEMLTILQNAKAALRFQGNLRKTPMVLCYVLADRALTLSLDEKGNGSILRAELLNASEAFSCLKDFSFMEDFQAGEETEMPSEADAEPEPLDKAHFPLLSEPVEGLMEREDVLFVADRFGRGEAFPSMRLSVVSTPEGRKLSVSDKEQLLIRDYRLQVLGEFLREMA
ncbi:MAG: hypothetical protein IJU50_10005 [Lachnospiraceae bacterium]|nr:hypothetical protein [Lachnospiraceae bacterium]